MLEKLKKLFKNQTEVADKPILKLTLRELSNIVQASECKELAVIEREEFTPLPVKYYSRGKLDCFVTEIDKATYFCRPPIEILLEVGDLKEILHIQSLIKGTDLSIETAHFEWKERNKI